MDIATADVNNDGHLDIVAAAGGWVTTLLGDGSGGFAALPAFEVRSAPDQIALGDLNGDGNIDLVVASTGLFQFPATFVEVFLGTGTGTFIFQQETDLGGKPTGITLADVDTDGHLDLVLGLLPSSGPSLLSVFTGDGTGNFPTRYDVFGTNQNPMRSYRIVAADLNHDGRPDLAVSGGTLAGITVLVNTSPRGCDDGLNLTYAGGTLNLNFTVSSAQPAIWSTWLAYRNNVVNLWALPIPPVEPAVNFNVPIHGFPMIGNVGILTTLSNPTFGLVCFDWKTVDTGGVGASLQELKDQITKSGIAKSLL